MSTKSLDTVVEDSNKPDYSAVCLPDKPPTEYSYVERRAELLQQVRDLGTPSALNQTELADRYGVSQQQISKDMDRIAEHVRSEMVDRSRRAFLVDSTVTRSIEELLKEGEYYKAAKLALDFDEWLTEFHDIEELSRKIEEIEQQ